MIYRLKIEERTFDCFPCQKRSCMFFLTFKKGNRNHNYLLTNTHLSTAIAWREKSILRRMYLTKGTNQIVADQVSKFYFDPSILITKKKWPKLAYKGNSYSALK
jgi:hypothetical protein